MIAKQTIAMQPEATCRSAQETATAEKTELMPSLLGGAMHVAPHACYWAVINDLPQKFNDEALRYAMEAWLPLPLEEVETRFVRLGSATIGCGVEHHHLREWINQHEQNHHCIESISPSSIPMCVLNRLGGDTPIDTQLILDRLEFRSRDYENPRRARKRVVAAVIIVAAIVLATSFVALGLVRRTDAARQRARQADIAIEQLAQIALGATSAASSAPSLRLTAAVRRLEATRDRSVSGLLAYNAGAALIDLLAVWPESIATQIDVVRVAQDVLTIKGRVRAASDAETLKLTLDDALLGWQAQSSNVTKGRVGYEFTLVFSHSASPDGNGDSP